MPEGNADASILIAVSWQALNRAIGKNATTSFTDCTVVILFASFFIEANLNFIIEEMGLSNEMRSFLNKPYPGLQDKLAWYYNKFVARNQFLTKRALYSNGITRKIRRKFNGLATIFKFRNDISHGKLNKTALSIENTLKLRQQAKDISEDLFIIANRTGYKITRSVDYFKALSTIT